MEETIESSELKEEFNEETEDIEDDLSSEESEVENEEVKEEEEFLETKKRTRTREEDDEDIVEERFYTIPLRNAWISPRKKRAPKAARIVKKFVLKHMKIRIAEEEDEEPERLVIDNEVNEKLWSKGIEKPPRKIRVRVIKNTEGVVTVLLAEGD